jgi:metal-responsive CopG/Arc/MetJ family transcriptional regulator
MKSHISATIDEELVQALHELRRKERRSLSNVLEAAVAEFLEKRSGNQQIGTSPGTFAGTFSRRETYAENKR